MAKWEYMVVQVAYDRPWKVNEQEIQNWVNGPGISQYLNQLGEQGWELVSAFYEIRSNTSGWPNYILKRPKPELNLEPRRTR